MLHVEWDPARIDLTAGDLYQMLLSGEPRIMTHARGDGHSFVLRPVAMKPGEYKVVAERLYEVFLKAPKPRERSLAAPKFDVSGHWDVQVKFLAGEATHLLFLEMEGNRIAGTYVGSRSRGDVRGTIEDDRVRFRSVLPCEEADLSYRFEGSVSGERMSGELDLDEYPKARWTAARRQYGARAARGRLSI